MLPMIKIDVRIDDGHDVDPQTHGRKDGDDQGEEFAFHLGPSFLVRLAASFLKRDFFSVSSAISSLDSSFCSVWGARWRLSMPPMATEIVPFSSDTMTTTASETSLVPTPARWRVPRSLGQVRIVAQRHHAARGRDAAAADDDRAVMQGGIFEKQVAQQLLGQLRVDDGAGLKVFVERRLALEHEQHADALARHDLAGLHGGVDGALLDRGGGFGGKQVEMQLRADPLERAAQLRLEDDDERDRADLKDLVEQPV